MDLQPLVKFCKSVVFRNSIKKQIHLPKGESQNLQSEIPNLQAENGAYLRLLRIRITFTAR